MLGFPSSFMKKFHDASIISLVLPTHVYIHTCCRVMGATKKAEAVVLLSTSKVVRKRCMFRVLCMFVCVCACISARRGASKRGKNK